MRVGVIGAGAVGGTIAAVLDRASHEVEIAARGENLLAIRESGLRLTGAWGTHIAHVNARDVLTHAQDLVVIAVKAQNTEAAIRANAHAFASTPIVIVQNGLHGIDLAHELAPHSDIVGALALFAASWVAPGEVTVTGDGATYLGVRDAERDLPARYAQSVLSPAMDVSIIGDFAGAQWTKLIVNQINALPAITGMSAQEVIATASLRRIMTAGMREAARVGMRAGVRFGELQGLNDRRVRAFSRLPLSLGRVLPESFARRMGPVPNPGSTLQSIRRGAATEIDFLNGAIVAEADRLGTSAPINAELVALVHEVEDSGRFFSPDEVATRIRV